MKRARRTRIAILAALTVASILAFNLLGWGTVCDGIASDGGLRAAVTCHCLPCCMDPRSHYYLEMDPPVAFRRLEGGSTLKLGASAAKPWARVRSEWSSRQYIGYLQGFDDVEGRRPSRIEFLGDRIVLWSEDGVVGTFELRRAE